MNYDVLHLKASEGLSQRAIAASLGTTHSTVRHWLKKHGIRTAPASCEGVIHNDRCAICKRATALGRRLCMSCWTRVRRLRTKLLAVRLLGGKCIRCGWSGHLAGFQFHHTGSKDFQIGSASNRKWAVVWKEIQKCELLCSNCHSAEHSKQEDPLLLAEAERFVRKGFIIADVAQSVEHRTENSGVIGANPIVGTNGRVV